MRIIDISGMIEDRMWDYGKPFPKVKIEEIASIEKDGYSAHKFLLSILSGTYLETGAHLFNSVKTVDKLKPEELIREAAVMKIPKKGTEAITAEELKKTGTKVKNGGTILIYTGWYKMWDKKEFVEKSPYFSHTAMDWIIEKKIKFLCGDFPCFDNHLHPVEGKELPLLKKFYKSGGMILSPVINGDKIRKKRVKLFAFPLKIKDLAAVPCRAIVIEG